MAQPKRRWSKARTGHKRSTWKLENQNLATCKHCHEPVLPAMNILETVILVFIPIVVVEIFKLLKINTTKDE